MAFPPTPPVFLLKLPAVIQSPSDVFKSLLRNSTTSSSFSRCIKFCKFAVDGGGNTSSSAEAPVKNAWRSNEQRKKSTVDSDRQAAIAAARDIGSGNLNLATRRSASQNSIPEKVEEELTDEQKEKREKLMNTVKSDIDELLSGDLSQKEMSESFKEYVGSEKYAKPRLSGVYEMVVRAVSEKAMKEKQRLALAHSLRLSLVGKEEKHAFIEGCINFCHFAVDTEMQSDIPVVWTHTAHLLMNTMHVPASVLGEEKTEVLSLEDLGPVFITAKQVDGKRKFDLFTNVLKELVAFCPLNSSKCVFAHFPVSVDLSPRP